MDATSLDRVCQALPIFPLPNVVLMPGALLPLHVFEPRYQALIRHVRAGEGMLGIATLQPGHEDAYEGSPPIFPEIGVGVVVAHQPLPDGRCNVVVQHLGQIRVERELATEHPFRIVQGPPLEVDPTGLAAAVSRLQVMVLQLGGVSPEAASEASRLVQLSPTELVDSLARRLLKEEDQQRAYLVCPRMVDRVAMVVSRLADFLAAVDPVARA